MNNTPTIIAVDGHLHIYPAYDIQTLFRNLIQNLGRLAVVAQDGETGPRNVCKLAFLAESREHDFFSRLQNQDKSIMVHGLEVTHGPDPLCVTVGIPGSGQVCLVAGRQIVTSERLEIIALAMRTKIPDGLPVRVLIEKVVAAGGIPVLPWSPGKWLFARGRMVRDLMTNNQGQVLCLGDTTLRPTMWPEPRLMQLARESDWAVIPGSDPLPFAGEERYAGTYGFVCQGAFDDARPVVSMRQILDGAGTLTPMGKRCSPWTMLRRLHKLRAVRQSA